MAGAKQHEMMFTLAAKKQSSFSSAFSGARQEFQSLYKEAAALTKQQNDISAYERQKSAVESTQNSLTRYQEKLANVQAALEKMGTAEGASTKETLALQQQEAELQFKVSETTRKLTEQEEKLGTMGKALEEAGVDTSNLGAESERLGKDLSDVKEKMDDIEEDGGVFDGAASSLEAFGAVAAAVGAEKLFAKIAEGMKACADASMEYETVMAGVRRTVGGTEEYLSGLSDSFLEMTTTMPITTTELAAIATTAGQLGIVQENVESFTEVMAKLDTTTDLTADDAATMLAQFANITRLKDYERLGSVVANLGDATATTATKVVQMSQGMAAAASLAGFSETNILAVSAAVGSLGIEAQAGSTAMSTLIQTLYKAVEKGGEDLENFASVAGMSAQEFADAWAGDPISAMDAFIKGLNDTERNGRSAIVILDELGITNVRQTKAILGLASAGDLLSNTVKQANAAWEENTALSEKANVMYSTTESKLTMMQNAYNNLKIAVGDRYTPVLAGLYETGATVLNWMTDVAQENPELVDAISTTTIGFAGLTAGIIAFNAAKKAAETINLASLLPSAAVLGGVAIAAAAIAAMVVSIRAAQEMYDEAYESSMSLTAASREQQAEIEHLTAEYDDLVAAGQGNSAEAVLLKNKIEDLTAEFDRSKQSVSEFSTQVSEAVAAEQELWQNYNSTMNGLDDQEESTINLIARLSDLSDQTTLTAADEAEMSAIIDELNSRYEDLGLTIDDVTGKNPVSLDAIKAMAQAADQQERFNTAFEAYGEAANSVAGLEAARGAALAELEAARAELAAADAARQAAYETGNTFQPLEDAYNIALVKVSEMESAYEDANAAIEDNNEKMAEAESILNEYSETVDSATEAIAAIQQEMDALQAEYAATYDAALESFQGQFDLFEEAPEIVAASIDDLVSALATQATYFTDYSANLLTIRERIDDLNSQGYDTSGLEAYINAANDGSSNAANAFAAIAGASDDALITLNENYAAKTAAEEAAADATAEFQTDYSARMDQMAADMAAAEADIAASSDALVSDLDRASEAGAAANSMMSSYVNTIYGFSNSAFSAGQSVANRALAGLNSVSYQGTIMASGYATGTESALAGWHWVGENGPELMRMRGGEQILNHEQSESLMNQMRESAAYAETAQQFQAYDAAQQPIEMDYSQRGSYTEVVVSPTIQITGVGSSAEMQSISEELMDQITETVMDAMEEAGINAKRGKLN